jgi:predicted dehydrogenase
MMRAPHALADQDQALAERHAVKLGAEKAYGDWRELVNDPLVGAGPPAPSPAPAAR